MSIPRPLPSVIGPTENALRALLARTLSSTHVPGYPAWAVLNAASSADAAPRWRQTVGNSLKAEPNEIDAAVAELRAAGLLRSDETLTALGDEELAAARVAVRDATLRLTDGIDDAEQETTRRVLDTIRRRAEDLLEG